jgi:hypothetical protein
VSEDRMEARITSEYEWSLDANKKRVVELELHLAAYKAAATLCEKHKPTGGTRSECVICVGESLSSALSRIDYICGTPNDMQCSGYDVHCNEAAVVDAVADLRKRYDDALEVIDQCAAVFKNNGQKRMQQLCEETINAARQGNKATDLLNPLSTPPEASLPNTGPVGAALDDARAKALWEAAPVVFTEDMSNLVDIFRHPPLEFSGFERGGRFLPFHGADVFSSDPVDFSAADCRNHHQGPTMTALERAAENRTYATCPECGHQHKDCDSWCGGNEGETECDECGTPFLYSRIIDISYTTRRTK